MNSNAVMSDLPKGLAKWASAAALIGCAASLGLHVLALLGVSFQTLFKFEMGLFVGVFPFAFLAEGAKERLLSDFRLNEKSTGNATEMWRQGFAQKVLQNALKAKAPLWLRAALKVLAVNALIQFAIFVYQTYPSNSPEKLTMLRMFSAYSAVFYCYIAMTLGSYAEFDRPLPSGDFV